MKEIFKVASEYFLYVNLEFSTIQILIYIYTDRLKYHSIIRVQVIHFNHFN